MRKIDAMVAEKVMGYKWYRAKECEWLCTHPMGKESLLAHFLRQNAAYMLGPGQEVSTCSEEVSDGSGMSVMSKEFMPMPGCGGWGSPKPYSTDIGAAWEVVEKIRERKDKNGGSVTCHVIDRVTEWHCDITSDDLRIDVLGAGDTAPLAICLAALRAVGVDEYKIQEAMR